MRYQNSEGNGTGNCQSATYWDIPQQAYCQNRLKCHILAKLFPHKDRIEDILSLGTVITGLHVNHNKHWKLEFCTYVYIHDEHGNSLTLCATSPVALRSTESTQDSHFFLNVKSESRVAHNNRTEIIETIHQIAAVCKKHKGIVFTNRNVNIINSQNEIDDNNSEITGVDGSDTTGWDGGSITGVVTPINIPTTVTNNTTEVEETSRT